MATINSKITSPSNLSPSHNELPMRNFMGVVDLYHFQGFWYPTPFFHQAMLAKSNFEAQDGDILLASSMKTGTTWLKALIPSIMHYTDNNHHDDHDGNDPLIENHPNELMPSLEIQIFSDKYTPINNEEHSPRLFRTHMPYGMLPDSIKNSNGCKIVYVTRDPKDTFVSLWHFINSLRELAKKTPFPIDEVFESFCEGVHPFGPFHDHVVGYWEESLKRPEDILFLKYEEMKSDPNGQVKKLAKFLGRPLNKDEDVEKIVWRCSLERIKNLEVNKSGLEPWLGLPKSSYFRRGVVGDWKNSLSVEMKKRLDDITCMKLQGSGLELDASSKV